MEELPALHPGSAASTAPEPPLDEAAAPPRRLGDLVFMAGCFALALLPASLAAVLLHRMIGEPVLFLAAVVVLVWVSTTVALLRIAGPLLHCRAIVAAGGLVSVAMCSLFLLD